MAVRGGAIYNQSHHAVFKAVRSGALVRPDHCSVCGVGGKIHAHHGNGYEPDHYLDVVWLCVTCHSKAHAAPPAVGELVQVKIDADVLRELDHQAVDWKLNRGPAMERVLRAGLDALKPSGGRRT